MVTKRSKWKTVAHKDAKIMNQGNTLTEPCIAETFVSELQNSVDTNNVSGNSANRDNLDEVDAASIVLKNRRDFERERVRIWSLRMKALDAPKDQTAKLER